MLCSAQMERHSTAFGATLMCPIGGLVHLVALGAFVGLFWWNVRKGSGVARSVTLEK